MILLWIGGGLRRPHQVNIQSVKLELYANTLDWLRLVMELGFVTYVGFQLGTEMNELISVASQGRPGDYLNDPWNILVRCRPPFQRSSKFELWPVFQLRPRT